MRIGQVHKSLIRPLMDQISSLERLHTSLIRPSVDMEQASDGHGIDLKHTYLKMASNTSNIGKNNSYGPYQAFCYRCSGHFNHLNRPG